MEEVTAPRTGSAYVLQLFQRLDLNGAVSCGQTLSGVDCVWTEAFFGDCDCVNPMRFAVCVPVGHQPEYSFRAVVLKLPMCICDAHYMGKRIVHYRIQ